MQPIAPFKSEAADWLAACNSLFFLSQCLCTHGWWVWGVACKKECTIKSLELQYSRRALKELLRKKKKEENKEERISLQSSVCYTTWDFWTCFDLAEGKKQFELFINSCFYCICYQCWHKIVQAPISLIRKAVECALPKKAEKNKHCWEFYVALDFKQLSNLT